MTQYLVRSQYNLRFADCKKKNKKIAFFFRKIFLKTT